MYIWCKGNLRYFIFHFVSTSVSAFLDLFRLLFSLLCNFRFLFSNPFTNLSSIDIPYQISVFISFAMQCFIQFCIAVCLLADVNNENWILIRINWFNMNFEHIKYVCYARITIYKEQKNKKIDMSFCLFVVSSIWWDACDFCEAAKRITDWFFSWLMLFLLNYSKVAKQISTC